MMVTAPKVRFTIIPQNKVMMCVACGRIPPFAIVIGSSGLCGSCLDQAKTQLNEAILGAIFEGPK